MNKEEQILSVLHEMQTAIHSIQAKQDSFETKLDSFETTQENILAAVVKIENEHGAKLQAVIDAQIAFEERLDNHEPRIVKLENKADRHDVEIAHLLRKAK